MITFEDFLEIVFNLIDNKIICESYPPVDDMKEFSEETPDFPTLVVKL